MKKMPAVFQTFEHPYAWLDLDALDANIRTMIAGSGDKDIRIATKSIRSTDVLRYIERAVDQRFAGWMTFTAAETAYLCEQGFDHFLLGYPTLEEKSVRQLMRWIHQGKDITFMVDAVEQVDFLKRLAEEEDVAAALCMDLNVSQQYPSLYFGTRRSALTNAKDTACFIDAILPSPYIYVVGLMGYDAQIAGVGDRPANKATGTVIRRLQQRAKKEVQKRRQKVVRYIEKKQGPLRFVNGGGTGSMAYTATCPEVSEVTIGSGLYRPGLFDYYDDMPFEVAAGYAIRATRRPSQTTIVAHGGGYIASGATGSDKMPVLADDELAFYATEGAGEVQTPLAMPKNKYAIGDSIVLRHAKAGELCERFQVLHGYRHNTYIGPMTTYRGEGQCFL